MENGPFIDGLPIKNGDFPWLSLFTRGYPLKMLDMPIVKLCMFATQYPMVPMTNPTSSMDPCSLQQDF